MAEMQPLLSKRSRILKRRTALWGERSTWDSHWRSIAENTLPRSSRFYASDRNKGGDKNSSIIDNTGPKALKILAAGMLSGSSSPARPWFRLTTPDPDLAAYGDVKVWLFHVQQIMLRIFNKSNTYAMLHAAYRELVAFGTSANVIMPNFKNVIHAHPLTVGEYALALDHFGEVNTLYRQFDMSVEQLVEWFGYDACSYSTKAAYDSSNYDQTRTVIQSIEPRRDRDPAMRDGKNMPFSSIYIEEGANESADLAGDPLREGGFKDFPCLAPRWEVLFNDVYGSSPGMSCLGDMIQLQQQQFLKSKGIAYMADPPLQVPVDLRGHDTDLLPGGVTYYSGAGAGTGIRTAFEVNLDLGLVLQDIQDVRERINSGFYADLFLMLTQMDNTKMTATEVAERHEEKLTQLGPVLENLHKELLAPLVEITFSRMLETGILPPPPPELNNVDLDVEFVSILAQAQRAINVNSTDRLVGHIGMLAQMGRPEAMDNFDADKSVERYADELGVDPDLIVSRDQVALVRASRAKQQAAQQAAAASASSADSLNKLGGVATQGGQSNAGSDLLNLFSGYNSPSGTELGGQ